MGESLREREVDASQSSQRARVFEFSSEGVRVFESSLLQESSGGPAECPPSKSSLREGRVQDSGGLGFE